MIYGLIDGRGSGFKGDDMLHEIYYNIGQVEVQDQIDVTKQVKLCTSYFVHYIVYYS